MGLACSTNWGEEERMYVIGGKARRKESARIGVKKNACTLLVGRPEGKSPLGRSRRRWVDNIRMDLGRCRMEQCGQPSDGKIYWPINRRL
jgi:hypothetical protein